MTGNVLTSLELSFHICETWIILPTMDHIRRITYDNTHVLHGVWYAAVQVGSKY